jgi:hypothetical protein
VGIGIGRVLIISQVFKATKSFLAEFFVEKRAKIKKNVWAVWILNFNKGLILPLLN